MSELNPELQLKVTVPVEGTPTGKTFDVTNFEDMLKIPLDRVPQFFRETEELVKMYHNLDAAMRATAKSLGITIPEDAKVVNFCTPDGKFKWTDDGKGEVGFKMKA